jgi:hypothetical protein
MLIRKLLFLTILSLLGNTSDPCFTNLLDQCSKKKGIIVNEYEKPTQKEGLKNMKIVAVIQLVFCILFFENIIMSNSASVIHAQQEVPPYAKWGSIAMQKTMGKYPNADIIDYLHIGREKGIETSTEKFKLLLKEDSKQFSVFVDIEFNNVTEEIMDISFRETP